MTTVVVTDSSGRPTSPTASVPPPSPPSPPATRSPAVVVVPITILLADRQFPDDRIDPALVDAAIARGDPIKTRAPSVIDYLDAVEGSEADAAVIVTPAAELTAMWRHASHTPWLADRPVAVVDSRTAASGQALVVEAAARPAAAGGSLSEVVDAAREAAERTRVLGAVGTAEPLLAAGVVERDQLAGDHAGPGRPTVFAARQGVIEPLRVLDGEDPAAALAALYAREPRAGDPVAFTGAGASLRMREMAGRLADLVGADREPEVCSPAMTIHTGRGVIGIAWLDRA
jgi:fatty acid-binding protein DegV